MNRLNVIVTVTLVVALVISVAVGWKTERDLKWQLHEVTAANETLRTSLGDLIHAVAQKDKEINRLSQMLRETTEEGTKRRLLK
jgi:hypothetical protein